MSVLCLRTTGMYVRSGLLQYLDILLILLLIGDDGLAGLVELRNDLVQLPSLREGRLSVQCIDTDSFGLVLGLGLVHKGLLRALVLPGLFDGRLLLSSMNVSDQLELIEWRRTSLRLDSLLAANSASC